MSRIGKQPIPVPSGVSVKLAGQDVSVSGPKGSCSWSAPSTAGLAYDEASRVFTVTRVNDTKQARANHGLSRSLIANMIKGVSTGFERRLLIYGTGYNCKLEGRTLHLNIGFMGRGLGSASQFQMTVPDGVDVVVETPAARGDNDPAKLLIRGADKQAVGQFAAEIRALRKTEPYKGKGIRYEGEVVRRKQGKALAGAG
ncbi:MAG: 50S ribosomal protein L6 [Planctomycetes bacterium]|nr:50S ribosomal protein L6 [Planctomycetota bacterium]MCH8250996.1 50S ribosomal protein L6 [Planctomycetota bacterium]